MTIKKISSLIAVMILVLVTASIEAGTLDLNAIYNEGNPFMGNNFLWTNVVESNGLSSAASNYYRHPETDGDSLVVRPTDFRVDVTPGPGIQELESELEMVIVGIDGATIPFVTYSGHGDFEVNERDLDEAHISALLTYSYEVLEGTSAGVSGSDSILFEDDLLLADGGWNHELEIELPEGTTSIRFRFNNRLRAEATTDLSSAFIAKRSNPGVTISVPEPAAALVLLIGVTIAFVGYRNG